MKILLVIGLVLALVFAGCAGSKPNNQPAASNLAPQVQPPAQTPVPKQTYACPNGTVVTVLSDCLKCPPLCDDKNSCTTDYCDLSTNYVCIHKPLDNVNCSTDMTCVSGECNENRPTFNLSTSNQIQLTTFSINNTAISSHQTNESLRFVTLVNNNRIQTLSRKNSYLKLDNRLNFIAKKCNEEMLMHGKSDLNICYGKYGSFKRLLRGLGFYGDELSYSSEINASSANLAQDLFNNLTENEKNLLTNQTIDNLIVTNPIFVDSIGVSIDCNSDICVQTTITAGNVEIFRPTFDNYDTTTYTFLNFSNNTFVPIQLTLRQSIDTDPITPTYFWVNFYENMSYDDASANYWWSDSWRRDKKHSYTKDVSWDTYFSETIRFPTVVFISFWGESSTHKAEIEVRYLPSNTNYSENELSTYLENVSARNAEIINNTSNKSLIELINQVRAASGYPILQESEDLNVLIRGMVDYAVRQNEYNNINLTANLGNFSSRPISYALASRNIFGGYIYSYKVMEEISSTKYQLDTLSPEAETLILGDAAENMEYFGSGLSCRNKICVSMLLLASNHNKLSPKNTRRGMLYGYLYFSYLKGSPFDYSKYPSVSIQFNSTTSANYYAYKGKTDGNEVWEELGTSGDWIPKDGWSTIDISGTKYYSQNFSRGTGSYLLVYQPLFDAYDEYGNFTFSITYTPNKKVE